MSNMDGETGGARPAIEVGDGQIKTAQPFHDRGRGLGRPTAEQMDSQVGQNGQAREVAKEVHGDYLGAHKVFKALVPNEPQRFLQKESPRHHAIVLMAAEGKYTNIEIAEALSVTPATVANTLKQPWAQDQILTTQDEAASGKVHNILSAAAEKFARRLVQEAGNMDARPSERIAAAVKGLDRLMGTPTQHIHKTEEVDFSGMDDEQVYAIAIGKAGTSQPS